MKEHPYYICADFGSALLPVKNINIENDDDIKTKVYQEHIPNSFGLKYNCIHNQYSEPVYIWNNSDPELVIKNFVEELETLALKSYQLTQQSKKTINYKEGQYKQHQLINNCENCNCELSYIKKADNEKVQHHNHITGEYLNTLCRKCNSKFQYKRFLPENIHNLKGYDSHLFIVGLYKYEQQNTDISCIPNN